MENVQIGEMLELSKESDEKLGEIVVLRIEATEHKTPFDHMETKGKLAEPERKYLTKAGLRMKKETARKLALELLKLAEE